jgi:hypothetical protein
MVILLIIVLPLEIVLCRKGLVSWSDTFPSNSKLRKALLIAPFMLVPVVVFGRPPSAAPPDMVRDLSWLTAVFALYLVATAIRARFLPPDREVLKQAAPHV